MMIGKEEIIRTLDALANWQGSLSLTDKERVALTFAVEYIKKHEETFEWCHDCKEYDRKEHCCHRWTKVIRDTVEELEKDRKCGMTREDKEAIIRRLEAMYGEAEDNETKESLFYALEALKEMPVEEYRQRLMELFHITDHDELITFVVMPKEEEFKSLEYILRQYKFEQRPHGKWIETDEDLKISDYRCSVCGQLTDLDEPWNFCPNCGADMREGESE